MSTTSTILLLLVVVVSMSASLTTADSSGKMTKLSFHMHDIVSGSNPTAVKVIKGPGSTVTAPMLGLKFGDTAVMDDPLTATSSPTSAELGRMQGIYMLASRAGAGALMVCANLVLTSGEHNGSTLAVLGRDDTGLDVREIPVVGGTGTFRMARGYVLWNKPEVVNGTDVTIQLDVFVATDGNGGSKSSSSGAATRTGGWVVAVLVALVVGSCVW